MGWLSKSLSFAWWRADARCIGGAHFRHVRQYFCSPTLIRGVTLLSSISCPCSIGVGGTSLAGGDDLAESETLSLLHLERLRSWIRGMPPRTSCNHNPFQEALIRVGDDQLPRGKPHPTKVKWLSANLHRTAFASRFRAAQITSPFSFSTQALMPTAMSMGSSSAVPPHPRTT